VMTINKILHRIHMQSSHAGKNKTLFTERMGAPQ
jgi:hypothetical protein